MSSAFWLEAAILSRRATLAANDPKQLLMLTQRESLPQILKPKVYRST
jgi:hypothetical protein